MEPDRDKSLPVVCIVDDEESVRRALSRLVESLGLRTELYATPAAFLAREPDTPVDCLLLDIQLPGVDGLELRELARQAGIDAPVIFITAHADRRNRARAARTDAIAFLEKPIDDRTLLLALETALFDHRLESGGEANPGADLPGGVMDGSAPRPGPGRGTPKRVGDGARLRPREKPESPGQGDPE